MSKSVYSLVLLDDVVREIDRLAHKERTSRSNLINQILAERVAYETPQDKHQRLFAKLITQLEATEAFSLSRQGKHTLTLQSALPYRYNPAVQYTLELRGEAAWLRVGIRSQNEALLARMHDYLNFWAALEGFHVKRLTGRAPQSEIEGQRYTRALHLEEGDAGAIAQYMELFDRTMKAYFQRAGVQDIEQEYAQALAGIVII